MVMDSGTALLVLAAIGLVLFGGVKFVDTIAERYPKLAHAFGRGKGAYKRGLEGKPLEEAAIAPGAPPP